MIESDAFIKHRRGSGSLSIVTGCCGVMVDVDSFAELLFLLLTLSSSLCPQLLRIHETPQRQRSPECTQTPTILKTYYK